MGVATQYNTNTLINANGGRVPREVQALLETPSIIKAIERLFDTLMDRGANVKVKRLKKGEARVIRIGQEALFELLCEHFMDNGGTYFELLDTTTVMFEMSWHQNAQEFSCVVYNRDECVHLDFNLLKEKVGLTAQSVFQRKRYSTIKISEITIGGDELDTDTDK